MEILMWIAALGGAYTIAYAVFWAEFMFPRWKRWAIGALGAGLIVAGFSIRSGYPELQRHHATDDDAQCWDARTNTC